MEHTNYCRQMVKQLSAKMLIPSVSTENKEAYSHAIDLANTSHKFLLPKGGFMIKDFDFKALDEFEELKLPFEFTALEFEIEEENKHLKAPEGSERCSGCIVFARERGDKIAINGAWKFASDGAWGVIPEIHIDRLGCFDRSIRNEDGGFPIHARFADGKARDWFPYKRPINSLLCFLNALACSNVHVERSEPKKAGKKVKSALPFDTYHVLTIDVPGRAGERGGPTGPHRAPREHLRRGHIRRLADGRRIWVNATVVAAGRGAGVVKKDYALRLAA